ncbi:MAG: hypothetical protein PHQ65_15850 [Bacteroidales bacterium]|nr:hypothetical protein [Bacteroidales bacterium]MDD3666739.1 hypothetical protein [Bacteroidales bacterium]
MKKNLLKSAIAFIIAATPLFISAQPTPGENSNGNAVGGNPIGGGAAPIAGGQIILLVAAIGYGSGKILQMNSCKWQKKR